MYFILYFYIVRTPYHDNNAINALELEPASPLKNKYPQKKNF